MDENESVIVRRLAFLERELDCMGNAADDAEHDLRLNPTDPLARRRLEAIYALAARTWTDIQDLRARQPGRGSLIHYDRHADASGARAYRQALS